MGRILLFMIAASIAWYLVRSFVARNRSASGSISDPKPPASAIPPRDQRQGHAEEKDVREARFRDL